MKNLEIIFMRNAGILDVTANTLDSAHAYKVIGFKKAVKAALNSLAEAERSILEEVGIKNPEAFDKEREELRKSGADAARLEDLDKQMRRLAELRKELYEENANLEGVKTLPFEQFHELQKENKDLPGKPLNIFEENLENILWAAPEE